jgi:mRNA-degrading endonuclease RelE of RelBE toxin-antitoxin system
MSNEIIITPNFKKEAKPLLKKYPSLKKELLGLEQKLLVSPYGGTPLGGNAFKIRLAVKSKGKGKSGGMRVIAYVDLNVVIENLTQIFLLSIYDKSEIDSISKEDIRRLITGLKG